MTHYHEALLTTPWSCEMSGVVGTMVTSMIEISSLMRIRQIFKQNGNPMHDGSHELLVTVVVPVKSGHDE